MPPRRSRLPIDVVHVITGLGQGGAEAMLGKLVLHAPEGAPARLHQRVISLTSLGALGIELRERGVEVTALDLHIAVGAAAALRRLHRELVRRQPHVVQGWMYHGNLVASVAARMAGVRHVAWNIRASRLARDEKWSTRALVHVGAHVARARRPRIVTNSEVALEAHVELGYPRPCFEVIPNGFELARFHPDPGARARIRVELALPPETPLIGLVARLHPMKDHELFVRAAARLAARHPDVHFLAAGADTEREDTPFAAAVRAASLDARLHRLGPRSDVPTLLAALDICTLTSRAGESFPNVLGEAMACGVVCVATRVGGCAEVLGDCGTIVPVGDADALADGWEALLRRPHAERQRLSSAVRHRVQAHFSLDAVSDRYVTLYERMVVDDACC